MPTWVADLYVDYIGFPLSVLLVPFVVFPPLAFFIAGFFSYLAKRKKRSFYFFVGMEWIFYGFWECCMWFWAKVVIAPIRFDLVLISPALVIPTLLAVVSLISAGSIQRK